MKYLLDTHAFLWFANNDAKLGENAKRIFLNQENEIMTSVSSIWEMAIKVSLEKLELPGSLQEFVRTHIRGNKIGIMSIELNHLYQLENLPYHHRDPFDRLIIAQAIAESIPILSRDEAFDLYPVQRIW